MSLPTRPRSSSPGRTSGAVPLPPAPPPPTLTAVGASARSLRGSARCPTMMWTLWRPASRNRTAGLLRSWWSPSRVRPEGSCCCPGRDGVKQRWLVDAFDLDRVFFGGCCIFWVARGVEKNGSESELFKVHVSSHPFFVLYLCEMKRKKFSALGWCCCPSS